jgi:hypothetical protein
MGQSGMHAALIYQHATSERDREIATAIDRRIAAKRSTPPPASTRKKKGRSR